MYAGSSPLARGLHSILRDIVELIGIIPARAGFTRRVRVHRPLRRIIPARAGFTGQFGLAVIDDRDHPRSRGVYHYLESRRLTGSGSSPLARGLLVNHIVAEIERRIIPARAGFTSPRSRRGLADRDHPRSRGVYPPAHDEITFTNGSSPLARGLLSGGWVEGQFGRIIPARAGFTSGAWRR